LKYIQFHEKWRRRLSTLSLIFVRLELKIENKMPQSQKRDLNDELEWKDTKIEKLAHETEK
jgi:hypothetical protein